MENSTLNYSHNKLSINQYLSIQHTLSKKQLGQHSTHCAINSITPYELGHKYIGFVHVISKTLDIIQLGTYKVSGVSRTLTHCSFGTIALGIGTSQVAQVFYC